MAVKNYDGAQNIGLTSAEQDSVEGGVKMVKWAIIDHGFSKEAVDMLDFTVTKHTLTISENERRSGAFHTQADGKPFYAITVSAPGSFMDMRIDESKKPTELAPKTQAQMLAFEIGVNLFGRVEKVIEEMYGVKEKGHGGGAGFPVAKIEIETTTRHDPFLFFMALTELVNFRLNQLAPKGAAPSAPANNAPAAAPSI